MNCEQVQEILGIYWDLSESDSMRTLMDKHLAGCPDCKEQFDIWSESMLLIQSNAMSDEAFDFAETVPTSGTVTTSVMNRIYANEAWRLPVQDKVYAISYKMRRNLTLVISFCLTLFIASLLYNVMYDGKIQPNQDIYSSNYSGLIPVATASGDVLSGTSSAGSGLKGIHVASLSDPFILDVGPIKSYPDYFVALSLLGLISALLVMNWFSRTRA